MNYALPLASAAALALLVPAIDAAGTLQAARAARAAAMERALAEASAPATPAAAFAATDARDARRRLSARIRDAAQGGGVMIEAMRSDDAIPGNIAALTIAASGPEKAVLAFADRLERDTVRVRFRNWRLVPVPGGVRLDAQALALWRR